jgi:hypothetical protein
MAGEHSPILDRYVQQDIGRTIRETASIGPDANLPSDIERLLETLKLREQSGEEMSRMMS